MTFERPVRRERAGPARIEMIMRKRIAVSVAALALTAGAGWMATQRAAAGELPLAPIPELADGRVPPMSDAELTETQIAFHEARVQANPGAALDRAALATLYLQRSREGGGFDDFRRAEDMARQSLNIRVTQNSRAARMLAASLLAQHRFIEAHDVANELVRLWPEDPAHRALLAEIQMELGDYPASAATLASLKRVRDNLSVAPRFARWAEMHGKTEEERALLYGAADLVAYSPDLPREQAAWFHLRVAEHELKHGRLLEAEQAVRNGLQIEPGDFRLVSLMVRLETQRGRYRQAIAYGEMVGEAADLRTLAAIGDAHAALGEAAAAERYYQMVEAEAAANPEPFNRQLYQFRLDHDRHLAETLATLQEEIEIRRDVLGYDLLAWALYKTGDIPAAQEAISQALRTGIREPNFFFHAGMIEQAAGNQKAARRYFRSALEINPNFHPEFAKLARKAL
jgi:tetratricopeptide (TPR) repeat protein